MGAYSQRLLYLLPADFLSFSHEGPGFALTHLILRCLLRVSKLIWHEEINAERERDRNREKEKVDREKGKRSMLMEQVQAEWSEEGRV